jgi:hypothetical protein
MSDQPIEEVKEGKEEEKVQQIEKKKNVKKV